MDAKEIIENIDDIYARFKVPAHLARHMRLVTGVTVWLCKHAKEPVDEELLIACALIHDIGNIVKFDFNHAVDRGTGIDVEELKLIQTEMEERYGKNDHLATTNMLKELDVDQELLTLLDLADWRMTSEVIKNGLLAPMILSYADQRVAPQGIVSLEERLEDVHARYQNKHSITFDESLFQKNAKDFRMLEKELFKHINGSPQDINEESIKEFAER